MALKRVNLMLDEELHRRLREEARKADTTMSELVRKLLTRSLGMTRSPSEVAARIRQLREVIGPMPDSAALVRRSRDRGW